MLCHCCQICCVEPRGRIAADGLFLFLLDGAQGARGAATPSAMIGLLAAGVVLTASLVVAANVVVEALTGLDATTASATNGTFRSVRIG